MKVLVRSPKSHQRGPHAGFRLGTQDLWGLVTKGRGAKGWLASLDCEPLN